MANGKFDLSNRVYAIMVIFLVAVVGVAIFIAISLWQSFSGDYPREITVEATGKAYVVPDIAEITLGLDVEAPTADEAVQKNSETMNKVSDALVAVGIPKEDIKTSYYNLAPKYNWTETRGSVQEGFLLSHSVVVQIRDFEKIGEVISKSTEAGANIFSGVQFTIDDPESAKTLAREEAVAKAKEKANVIAEQSGLSIGKVLNYYEYQDGYGTPMYYEKSMAMDMAEESVGSAITPPSIEPGQQEVQLTVSLTYRLK